MDANGYKTIKKYQKLIVAKKTVITWKKKRLL